MKTNELTGAALDWAVAKCEGWETVTAKDNTGEHLWLMKGDKDMNPKQCRFSTNWAQGGPIIERERIDVTFMDGDEVDTWHISGAHGRDKSPLVSAMRCYVAIKLGDEVEIPKELT